MTTIRIGGVRFQGLPDDHARSRTPAETCQGPRDRCPDRSGNCTSQGSEPTDGPGPQGILSTPRGSGPACSFDWRRSGNSASDVTRTRTRNAATAASDRDRRAGDRIALAGARNRSLHTRDSRWRVRYTAMDVGARQKRRKRTKPGEDSCFKA